MKQIALIVLLIPAFAQAADFSDVSAIEARLTKHDAEIADMQAKIAALKLAIRCPCPRGGVCICGDDCPCPNCPKHKKGEAKDVGAVAPVVPVVIGGKEWKASRPTNKGREVLYFGREDCPNCPGAIERLGEYTKQIVYVDCTKDDTLAAMFGVDTYPTLIAADDGLKVEAHHAEGDSVGSYFAEKWLGSVTDKPDHEHGRSWLDMTALRRHLVGEHGYSATEVYEMTDEEVRATHDKAHGTIKAAPKVTYSVPRTTSRAPTYSSARSVVRYGGSTWTWPGNLRQHLESVHGVNTAGLSDSQLRTVHDNLHNTGRSGITGGSSYGGSSYVRPAVQYSRSSYQPRVYYSSGYSYGGCPSGNCPR